jgi:hypothetical protein
MINAPKVLRDLAERLYCERTLDSLQSNASRCQQSCLGRSNRRPFPARRVRQLAAWWPLSANLSGNGAQLGDQGARKRRWRIVASQRDANWPGYALQTNREDLEESPALGTAGLKFCRAENALVRITRAR